MAEKREECIYLAKLCEQAERYDEMTQYMDSIVEMGQELSVEERNLLSVAYKNVVGARRAAWRIISSVEQKEKFKSNEENVRRAQTYRLKVEDELKEICGKILKLLNDYLLKNTKSDESIVFFHKMKGDYFRYISEFSTNDAKTSASEKAQEAYQAATALATSNMASTNPIRLGLALNYSVFYYEILNNAEEACRIAREAFEGAISDLDNVGEESYKDSTLIMQLLRDNLTLWTSDNAEN